jgi:hypothetical protein
LEPELAVALPAAGAACATALRPRPHLAVVVSSLLGIGGVAAVLLSTPGLVSDATGVTLAMSAPGRAMLIVASVSLALIVVSAPERAERASLLRWGLAGLAGMAAITVAPSMDAVILVLLAMVALQAVAPGTRPLHRRIRAPGLAVAMLAAGLVFTRLEGPPLLERLGAVGIVAGLVAAVGALPYMHEFESEENTAVSPLAWAAFVGPVLAVAVLARTHVLFPSAAGAFGSMLIGLGLLNIVWGCIAAWRTKRDVDAWRYSFTADWGLALCGFGMALPDAQASALLILSAILLSRLPLYLWSRQALREKVQTDRSINMLVAASLTGSAPFIGFAARVLLLRGATALYWPLALVVAASLLLWVPSALRLGRSLGRPQGRQLVGIALVLAITVGLGVYPQPLLTLAGL